LDIYKHWQMEYEMKFKGTHISFVLYLMKVEHDHISHQTKFQSFLSFKHKN
jgi:hypothetical protein